MLSVIFLLLYIFVFSDLCVAFSVLVFTFGVAHNVSEMVVLRSNFRVVYAQCIGVTSLFTIHDALNSHIFCKPHLFNSPVQF